LRSSHSWRNAISLEFCTVHPATISSGYRSVRICRPHRETIKIAQIGELTRRKAVTLRDTIAIGIAVAAGFAGAENVVYLFRSSNDVADLLMIRTITANPLHLAVAVIASSYVFMAVTDQTKLHFLAIAVLVSTLFHGLYDYPHHEFGRPLLQIYFRACICRRVGMAHRARKKPAFLIFFKVSKLGAHSFSLLLICFFKILVRSDLLHYHLLLVIERYCQTLAHSPHACFTTRSWSRVGFAPLVMALVITALTRSNVFLPSNTIIFLPTRGGGVQTKCR